ncbi:alpha-2-macroglobulin family protein [Abyssalbus ytuae]|uniref:MG2 domain-containing protein n=1 Tax=Abyssalbus ytuae TaxID=2926907 RepID=A0A9E7D0T5_9FLAO|nr:MG2 domain-containing protein [Abyssalbus ytuae]UOB16358.1 MG2 domain-containing protein [Abyssalbus ytuae]
MKKYLILAIAFILNIHLSQSQNNYSSLWEKVDNLEKEGLTKSALKIVEDIKAKASKEKEINQKIKALMYASKYALVLEEDAQLLIINNFKQEISDAKFPERNILHSILANLYWQYFQQNRWIIYNRTKTAVKVDKQDFRTWDLQTLFNETSYHFSRSLEKGLMLQQENLSKYDPLLETAKGSKIFRPTLYDFLSHQALQFYKTDENNITKPSYKFEIDNPEYLGEARNFSSLNITAKDTASLQLKALKIYQDLIKFHLNDKEPFALVDVDIDRLNFVKQHATFSGKETMLLKTLASSKNNFKSHEVSGLYDFEVATVLHNQGNTYDPVTNTENQWKRKEAVEICENVISKFPNSVGAEKCKVLKKQILQEELNIQAEAFIPVNKPSKVLVRYKNLSQLNFKLYKLSKSQVEKFNSFYRISDKQNFIKNLDNTSQWSASLKNENDYQLHTTELKIPELDNGFYLIYASPEKNGDNNFAYSIIQSTNLALVDKRDQNKATFQFINRNNGQPVTGMKIKISYKKTYNGNIFNKEYTTDKNGEIHILNSERYIDVNVYAKSKGDEAYFGPLYIYGSNPHTETKYPEAFLFTDRSIYRPGQTAFFKGIVVQKKEDSSVILENMPVTVTLRDANWQEIKTLSLKTNEFGSFYGEFIVPNSGLTGNFTLQATSKQVNLQGNTSIVVEEYKRPKFETKFNPVSDTYKINDNITIKGTATAYAGSNITNAKVVYRVHRKVQYPVWYYWSRPYFNSEPQEIAHGETTTNEKGEYEITFKALADKSIDEKNLPVFNYEVTADVTDINGETRSATTIVNVGYHALTASLSIPEKLDKDKKDHKIQVSTQNLNGQFVPAQVTVKIYKLNSPDKVLRPRPWAAPDYLAFTKEEFTQLFPHEAYNNENDFKKWEKGPLVFEKTFNTANEKEPALGNIKKWESGKYIAELNTTDKFGREVKDVQFTHLYSEKDKTAPDNQLFTITTDKNQYKTGEEVEIKLSSAAQNIFVTIDVEKDRKIVSTYVFNLSNSCEELKIPVNKNDLGGFAVHYSLAAFNTYQNGTLNISVPYPSAQLEIETVTFRDKLQPGQEETWSFKIKGPAGDKVTAEILAGMYDASLDQFLNHQWSFNPNYRLPYSSYNRFNANYSFDIERFQYHNNKRDDYTLPKQYYDHLNWFGLYFGNNLRLRGMATRKSMPAPAAMEMNGAVEVVEEEMAEVSFAKGDTVLANSEADGSGVKEEEQNASASFDGIQPRKNLQETAFFFPQLKTDEEGNVSFSFTTPEALTQWKLQLLAHTRNLETAVKAFTSVTQKELMVIPNAPRFLRQGDKITISSKISNLTDKALSGTATLQLFDALTGKPVDTKLANTNNNKDFSLAAQGNSSVSWTLQIPDDIQAVQYKVLAKAGSFSDGEQNTLPVLTNRMLVTETLHMWVGSGQTKTFTLDKLKNNNSTTLKHHQLTLEITSNPAWYAVQSLPYLMEYPFECNEQIFARYYANKLASHIANSNPRIKEVFDQWKNTEALLSNLEKNEELKSLLIEETPWLRDAHSESEQKKRIGLLFDLTKMSYELQNAKSKLMLSQMEDGAWPWFNGGYPSRFITQHIITGFGHLHHLNVEEFDGDTQQMIHKAVSYLDKAFVKEYEQMKEYAKDLNDDHLSYTQIHYLYMRSFFKEIPLPENVKEITSYYIKQAQKYWLNKNLYAKGQLALILYRSNDKNTAGKILRSLKENSITSQELGMYWKENTAGWFWYQAPIETQSLMIEAFSEIENDTNTIDKLRIWLLKNKQTNRWETTKATTEAVYALLLQGSDWLSVTDMVDVNVGKMKITPEKLEDVKVEAGTGYYKTSWAGAEVTPQMAQVTLTKKGTGIAWGGLYWQYFEDLDKITHADTPLKLSKKLFLKKNTDRGEELKAINNNTTLEVGDLVRVRIELKADREMEFVHMKDMRAAGLEPVNVLSQYKWQDGLGYYESTKDASTNFFFDYLPKGVFVFEYDLRINNAGNFSNGITTIQCMYAPEFTSHSEGVRINIEH